MQLYLEKWINEMKGIAKIYNEEFLIDDWNLLVDLKYSSLDECNKK